VGRAGAPRKRRHFLISAAAVELFAACEVVDIHTESFVWTRLTRYDLTRRHGPGLLQARFARQADLTRMREVGMAGAVFSVATNPLRPASRRTDTLLANLDRLRGMLAGAATVVGGSASWRRARAGGRLGCFLAVQGGNAIGRLADVARLPDDLVRVTLLHLTDSSLGATSSPLGLRRRRTGLTPFGRELIPALEERAILVDLAHVSRPGFWDAVDAHDRGRPVVVSHTGLAGVHPSWRNLDDDQVRAVAGSGGVVGVMYHRSFLGRPARTVGAEAIVRHLEHAIAVGGEEVAALGSDWDGTIVTPRDMPTVSELPVLVEHMLRRGWGAERVGRVLGGNWLRVVEAVRPER
jgi:membrane dipeptidase